MLHGATVLPSTIAVLLLLAGCAPDSDNGADCTRAAHPSATKAPAADGRTFPRLFVPQTGEGSRPSDLVLVDVRVAATGGLDRIVLEFSGTGTPGWVVNYAEKAVLDGSGEAVDLGGRSTLDIYASDTTWPASGYYDGPAHLVPRSSGHITDVYVGGTFEGTTQVLAGIDGEPVPFRVFTRTAPSRLVIEVTDRVHENADVHRMSDSTGVPSNGSSPSTASASTRQRARR